MGYQARVKTWIAGETLYAADLNAEFDAILATMIPDPSGATRGDLFYRGESSWQRLAMGTDGYVLTASGSGSDPAWEASASGFSDPLTTQGDIIIRGASSTTRLAAGTAGQALTTGGGSANPAWAGMTTQGDTEYHNGTTRTRLAAGTVGMALVTGGAGANPSWVGMTTSGDIEYHNGTTRTRLAKGTAYQILSMNSGATAPEWASFGSSHLPSATAGNYIDGTWTLPNQVTVLNTSFDKVASIYISRAGTYRFITLIGSTWATDDISGWSAGDIAQLYVYLYTGSIVRTKVYRDGVAVGALKALNASTIQYFAACSASPIVNGGLYTDLNTTQIL